jgi:hypothetical protein
MLGNPARATDPVLDANEAYEIRLLLKVRALRATAASSEFAPEAQAFAAKAQALADKYGIDPELLDFPRESLKLAVVISEMRRIKAILIDFEADPTEWVDKTVEWSELLDEYDGVMEVACDVLDMPLPKLPYGCRRHFRPSERARIEALIWERVSMKDNPSLYEYQDSV